MGNNVYVVLSVLVRVLPVLLYWYEYIVQQYSLLSTRTCVSGYCCTAVLLLYFRIATSRENLHKGGGYHLQQITNYKLQITTALLDIFLLLYSYPEYS